MSFPRFLSSVRAPRDLHSFPTRRSSDLHLRLIPSVRGTVAGGVDEHADAVRRGSELVQRRDAELAPTADRIGVDRKSTRLNSSHLGISYAVFCLKKKKKTQKSAQ